MYVVFADTVMKNRINERKSNNSFLMIVPGLGLFLRRFNGSYFSSLLPLLSPSERQSVVVVGLNLSVNLLMVLEGHEFILCGMTCSLTDDGDRQHIVGCTFLLP